MENLAQPQSRTLEPSESAFSFHLYRRRPLRSRTYDTLVQILSNCRTESPQPHVQGGNDAEVRQSCESGTSGVEFRQMIDENVTGNHDQTKSIDELDDRPNYKELEGDLVEETEIDKSREITEQIKAPESDQINLVMDKKKEVAGENCISIADFLMDENQTDDCTLETVKEQKDVNGILNFEMDDFSSMGQLELDKEFSVHDFFEVLNSSFGDNMNVESSKAVENGKDATYVAENILKESEHQLQLKEMELEKLISDPCMIDSFGFVNGGQEIEKGGIYGVVDELLDESSEDAVSLGDKSTGLAHAYEDNVDKEVLTCNDGERGRYRHDMSNPSIINTSNNDGHSDKAEHKATIMLMQESDFQNVLCEKDKETNKLSSGASCLEKLSWCDRNLGENDAENQIDVATIQGDDANKKKRKKGPLTKERKAKKKKKERIKRAEKNRELGVKRLKLPPPVLKPKTVKHCRHYLQGRCHEGEKCKFSHDVVPLTKSKPCCYFARQSCMKGDDCPFDHELSKYPCNNYATNSFCSRGSDCLFSHEIPANQSSPTTPSVSKPEKKGSAMILDDLEPYVKLPRPLNNLNSGGKTDSRGIFPKKVNDAKLLSGRNSSGKKVEQVLEKVKTAKKTPKGVCFLLCEGMPAGDPNRQRRDESSPMPGGNADVQKTILNGPVSTNKSNEMSAVEAPRKPRGINFLSFAQTPSLDDASCKALSNLFSSGGYDGKGKQSLLSSKSGLIVEASKHMSPNCNGANARRGE